jgi:hypothetical protein
MNQPIIIPPLLSGKTLSEQIAEHNARVERIWLAVGSRCKPFRPSSSTEPVPEPDLSRVRLAAECSGLIHERRP